MSYHVGWDYFSPDPDTKTEMHCRVCNAKMDVQRGVNGPTSSIGAMAGFKHLHDSFFCPFSKENWHQQVLALKSRIGKEISKKLIDILTEEMEEILKTKTPTLDRYWTFLI